MAMGPTPSGGRGGRRTPMAEINVTPLVDVMLVLLIIFMITAPLLMTGVPIHLPDSRAKALEQPKKPIQISIDAQGQVFVDDDQVDDAALPDRLARIAAQGPVGGEPQQIFLRADRGIDYGRVMAVMGELNRAGLNKVALVSTPADERR
ncbi:MAG: protein TolR [Sphingomonas oligoaromativorans]|jgi:biopolymer transport protein TolR|uniref:protein TolR n=1 Tax=Sphingomonas oligoaromativorans TaxID=575322 RepID=UPI001422445A|nr:protein TolR [Sphingomonas oligoaromativorans]NIJ34407.1 biopolymer transport protein TolR [Sphingomonas oligoaromativorans]